jgi:hypothetical protein
MPIPYDPANPDFEAVRRIFFDWLRANPRGAQLSRTGDTYLPYVEFAGSRDPQVLAFHIVEVFWQLLLEGIVAPGMNSSNMDLPWFHLTSYGHAVLQQESGHPHDPAGYLERVRSRVPAPDDTVMAYLSESLTAFRRGTIVAAAVMLGVAAERVFLLVCDGILGALGDPREKATFERLVERFAMKPKLDWVHEKLQVVQNRRLAGFPENATLMVTAVYDLLRSQRNDLGHPREVPPKLDRQELFANLQVFPRFYETAEQLRTFLSGTQI